MHQSKSDLFHSVSSNTFFLSWTHKWIKRDSKAISSTDMSVIQDLLLSVWHNKINKNSGAFILCTLRS